MIDMLKDLFEKQTKLMNVIKSNSNNGLNNTAFWEDIGPFDDYRKFMLAHALLDETMEYFHDLKWKWWKKLKNYKVDETNRKHVELPDIFHFFIQLCIEEGITPEDLYHDYNEKLQENYLRQETNY